MTKPRAIAAMAAVLSFIAGSAILLAQSPVQGEKKGHGYGPGTDKTLYVWAGDQAHIAPDFLAVIDFDEQSARYGQVIKTVPLPPPGNVGNEAHHCHLNSTKTILGCGGLLSLLKGQNGIFFFALKNAA
jgi:56kDa selenium binding protein (SBP56)